MKKILITGGAGFIGSNLCLQLLKKNYQITVLDNLSPQIHGHDPIITSALYQSIAGKVNFIHGSVTEAADIARAIADNEIIVHFAAETGTGQSMYQIEKYADVNIRGTAVLLDHLANNPHSVKRIVVASSRAIYGEGKYYSPELKKHVYPLSRQSADMEAEEFEVKWPGTTHLEVTATDEDAIIHPISIYGITKQNQEQLVMTFCESMGLEGVAFRYQNVYGPGQSLSNPYTGILSIFSTLIKNGKSINIFEDGKESRDFVFINDVVNATILGIEHPAAANQVFNVGTGVGTSVMQIADLLIKNYGTNVPVAISGKFRVGDIRHCYADLTKIKNLLGFAPAVGIEEGLKHFCEWVQTQEVKESAYDKSIQELKEKGLYK
ncbi:NAD-dependent epimerase/dehydratase family protein [Chitinophaga dinghuensis]|nr:NAD-dependent epimerase/dehydratase family protein [Chitinophaga dinghuensis]